MTVVIQGSNRADNFTAHFSSAVMELLSGLGESAQLIDLRDFPGEAIHPRMYGADEFHPFLVEAQATLRAAERWVFVFPEYNGTFPGILKLFIDAISVIKYPTTFQAKSAALVGTATGRSGNVRGLDHFGAVMSHLGVTVMPQSLPISQIASLVDAETGRLDDPTIELLRTQLTRFLAFAPSIAVN